MTKLLKKQKQFQENLVEIVVLLAFLTNNYGIIDGCYYSLLSNKTSRKTKTFITISSYKFQINKKYIIEMEINGKLKEIDIKNRTCYYFDEII